MSQLIAISYPQEATAQRARDEVNQLIQRPDTARAIIRNTQGSIWVATNPYGLAVGIIWGWSGGFWSAWTLGTGLGVVMGAGLGAVLAKVDRSGINRAFQGRVRGMLKPGTSTLVMQVEVGTWDAVAGGPQPLWGTVLESSLSLDAEWRLQEALLRGTTG